MKTLINYADKRYEPTRKWNTWTAKHIAKFDKVYECRPEDIDSHFKVTNKNILSHKRGNGLWLWKPYFIDRALTQSSNGDIIFYCDAGAFFIRNINKIIENLSETTPLFVCDIPLIESCFTKPLCFETMKCNNDETRHSNQIIATYFAIYVCDKSRSFIKEWLSNCCCYDLISPLGSLEINTNYQNAFVVHREDQSIFSLLCKKFNIKPHKDISQRARNPRSYYNPLYSYKEPIHPDDKYAPIIYLHKAPCLSLYVLIKPYIKRVYTNSIIRWKQKLA